MALDASIRKRIEGFLAAGGAEGSRLSADGRRLWRHAQKWIRQHLITPTSPEALELACLALQLPMKNLAALSVGRFGQVSLRDRAEAAIEILVGKLGDQIDGTLLDATTELLQEMFQRKPRSEEARLLADVVNLEDFGVSGIVQQAILVAARGQGIDELLEAAEKRDAYGYFEARLKDGFHFGPVRELARRRLARGRQVIELLKSELSETEE
ncbi:MAG: hypothetical protein NZ561_12925 [Phycisphaerae bacterium]|nr:hypothetical protein [Phycisphaerae bacterium]MDW8261838.1 hypothetical protein [Phycisphaerales bacterium]